MVTEMLVSLQLLYTATEREREIERVCLCMRAHESNMMLAFFVGCLVFCIPHNTVRDISVLVTKPPTLRALSLLQSL